MVLLVVLGMLTFFSILIASYLVFANQSRQSSFVIASRNIRAADTRAIIDEALMTLIRGTGDPTSPFFGEDLLSDYYGRFDAVDATIAATVTTRFLGQRFVRIPLVLPAHVTVNNIDDQFSNRVVTIVNPNSPLDGQSMRVIRSRFINPHHYLYLELSQRVVETRSDLIDEAGMATLFPTNSVVHVNGIPRNSVGIGFNGTNLDLPADLLSAPFHQGLSLPAALQPNTFGGRVAKMALDPNTGLPVTERGDFDESFDAGDFNNWYLSYRDSDGRITPSFHRPAVINYILNDPSISGGLADPTTQGNLLVSLARGTFRPLPFFDPWLRWNPLTSPPPPEPFPAPILPIRPAGDLFPRPRDRGLLNPEFTGSNSSFALRAPITLPANAAGASFRLNQLALALIGDQTAGATMRDRNPWDVDNDGDGIPDSVWVDLGLPNIVSQEGKLLRPLVATMIEDLSARLNVNAHGNYTLPLSVNTNAGARGRATYAGTDVSFANVDPDINQTFRGIGYGPSEIIIPQLGNLGWLQARYRNGSTSDVTTPNVGANGRDAFDLVRSGWRVPTHGANTGYGYSVDPFGRSGVGLGRDGSVVMALSGLAANPGGGDEAVNHPYEADPTGRLAGDHHFTFEELEPILRSKSFDLEMLPPRLRDLAAAALNNFPELDKGLTNYSVSDDSPTPLEFSGTRQFTLLQSAIDWLGIQTAAWLPDDPNDANNANRISNRIRELMAPELRLGRKIDINRAFGNGIDDNNNQVKDEPMEVNRQQGNPPVVADEVRLGTAFAVNPSTVGSLPGDYTNHVPDYRHGRAESDHVDARALLARDLYLLMMAAARGVEFPGINPASPMPAGERQAYRARRIAQWAVNVVDFRDPDSISTRFVYDENPFNGWDVRFRSVNITTGVPIDIVIGSPGAGYSPEVWGVEQPELIFSESAAFHDVRVRDTNLDSTNRTKADRDPMFADWDLNTDQVRIPQGSLFLELYCPRPTVEATGFDQSSKQGFPRELYKYLDENDQSSQATLALDLATLAPGGVPVWRIAISKPHPNNDWNNPRPLDVTNTTDDPFERWHNPTTPANLRRDTVSFDPARPDEIDVAATPTRVDRYIWFRSFAQQSDISDLLTSAQIPPTEMTADQVFFVPSTIGTNSDSRVAPGQYLTIAPRPITNLGSAVFAGNSPIRPSQQRFAVLGNQGVIHFNEANTRLTPPLGLTHPANFTPAKPLIVGAFPPMGEAWANVFSTNANENYVGLNVSEPLPVPGGYYMNPTTSLPPANRYGGNANANYPLSDSFVNFAVPGSAIDNPLDTSFNYIPAIEVSEPDPDGGPDRTALEPFLGTLPRYCSAFLQRLADPLRPYNAITNPYITVDYIPIDLTVFSGEENPTDVSTNPVRFTSRSRQRNGHIRSVDGLTTVASNALFSHETHFETPVAAPPLGSTYFSVGNEGHFYSSFNFLNTQYTLTNPVNPGFTGFAQSLGQSNAPNIEGHDRNLPQTPFARISWFNRPYSSHLELLVVPACSSSRLFAEFSTVDSAGEPLIYSSATNADAIARLYGPFRHLMNFFHGDERNTANSEFSHFFNLAGTLPRFRREVELITPSRIEGLAAAERTWMRELLHAPFNFKYDNRRQGRINLNTVSSFEVYRGLMHGHMNNNEFTDAANGQFGFNRFVQNRRGFVPSEAYSEVNTSGTPVNFDPSRFDSRYPTEFGATYREHADGRFAPMLRSGNDDLRISNADATLLRRSDGLVGSPPTDDAAFLVRRQAEAPVNARQNRSRDAFIRYQTLSRMPNLVSNNSQSFVVWITVGLFEVDAQTNALGREYNEHLGTNERFQAMFIIDRSIPVGFIPGRDLNARDVVVFEKYFQ